MLRDRIGPTPGRMLAQHMLRFSQLPAQPCILRVQIGLPGAKVTWDGVLWQTIIHMTFIASALGLAYVDWISARVATINHGTPEDD